MAAPITLLTSLPEGALLNRVVACLGDVAVVRNIDALHSVNGDLLVSFSHSMIVPEDELRLFANGAFNVHGGSPQYPGRDPHHWACYDGATRYGATMHVMSSRVDEGEIVDVEWFSVRPAVTPQDLLHAANDAAIVILARCAEKLRKREPLQPLVGVSWTGQKRSRRDFLEICRLPADISRSEFDRRVRAFDVPGRANLSVEIHGRTFRIEGPQSKDVGQR